MARSHIVAPLFRFHGSLIKPVAVLSNGSLWRSGSLRIPGLFNRDVAIGGDGSLLSYVALAHVGLLLPYVAVGSDGSLVSIVTLIPMDCSSRVLLSSLMARSANMVLLTFVGLLRRCVSFYGYGSLSPIVSLLLGGSLKRLGAFATTGSFQDYVAVD